MEETMTSRPCLLANGAVLPGFFAIPALAQTASDGSSGIRASEVVVVTARRREEAQQDVPIAITALSGTALAAQRLDGAMNLQQIVPNMTFSRAALGENNYQIRGIGYQLVSTAGDAGVSVHINNAPIAVNRLADAEFFDVSRVEVLRGPQGTLYGRNATGGVINVITAPPVGELEGSVNAEFGNFDAMRFNGMVNVPIGEAVAIRAAGVYLARDGFQFNEATGNRVDDRSLWSARLALGTTGDGPFDATLTWETFREDDTRSGGVRDLCAKDPGPAEVGGVPVLSPDARNLLSRGCGRASIYSPAASGSENSVATLYGVLPVLLGLQTGDAYA
jgi:outer membrane receptor protein involved in Fe transport